MIKLLEKGTYRLGLNKAKQRLLFLGEHRYVWSHTNKAGDTLSVYKEPYKLGSILEEGVYKVYKVKNEPKYVDLHHLELLPQPGTRQGYLVLTELPTDQKVESRILPTSEIITP